MGLFVYILAVLRATHLRLLGA